MDQFIHIIAVAIRYYEFIIVIRIILSWAPVDPQNPIVQFIGRFTDPLLDAVRRAFPFLSAGGIDFSPILVFFLLDATRHMLLQFVMQIN